MAEPVPTPQSQSVQQNLPVQNLPVVIQPDPMLDVRGGIVPTIAMSLGALAIVVLVLYGITRPEAPEQLASTPSASAPAQPASGSAQTQKPAPSTTGQGQTQPPPKQQAQ